MVSADRGMKQLYDIPAGEVKYWIHLSSPRESNLGAVAQYILKNRGIEVEVSKRGGLPHTMGRIYCCTPETNSTIGIDLGRPEDGKAKLTGWNDGRPELVYIATLVGEDIMANEAAYGNYCLPKSIIKSAVEAGGGAVGARLSKPRYAFKDAVALDNANYHIFHLNLPKEDSCDFKLGCGKVVLAAKESLEIKDIAGLKEFAKQYPPRVGASWRFDDLVELYMDSVLGDGKYLMVKDKRGNGKSLPKGMYGSPEADPNIDLVVEFMQTGRTLKENKFVVIDELMQSRPIIVTKGANDKLVKEFFGDLLSE